jgi:ABC-2 type transport system permease protein
MSSVATMSFAFRPSRVAAVMWRDLTITRSYSYALVFDVTFGVLELLIYFFVSRTFQDSSTADLNGAPTYFAFVAVGIVMTLIVGAASAAVAEQLRSEQQTGTLETLVAQPITAAELCLGMVGFPLVFAAFRAAIYLGVALVLLGVALPDADWIGFIAVVGTATSVLLAIGIAFAAYRVAFKRGVTAGWIVSFGLGFAGGAYFPTSVMPDWLRPITEIVPTRYLYDGARSALFEGGRWGSAAAVLALYGVVFLPATIWLFAYSLRFAKRRGTLSEY